MLLGFLWLLDLSVSYQLSAISCQLSAVSYRMLDKSIGAIPVFLIPREHRCDRTIALYPWGKLISFGSNLSTRTIQKHTAGFIPSKLTNAWHSERAPTVILTEHELYTHENRVVLEKQAK